MSLHLRQYQLAAGWGMIALAGLVAGWTGYVSESARLTGGLLENARRAAAAFSVRELDGGAAADAITARLQSMLAAGPTFRGLEILRGSADNPRAATVARVANRPPPEPGAAPPFSPPGPSNYAGPFTDTNGIWAVADAPIGEAGSSGARYGLELTIDASDWRLARASAGLLRALYVWALLGLPLGAWRLRQRQREQREVIRNLSEAIEQSHSALLIVDRFGRIEYVNQRLCQQFGYARRDLLGQRCRDFRAPEMPDAQLAEVVAALRAGQAWEGEWLNRRQDGTTYPARGVVTPVKKRDGSLACFAAVFDDVTDSKRREAELLEARDLAEAGDRAKSHFLATMSHEVRTPLNGIVGFTSLLLETSLSADQRDYVQTIRASGEALIQLTSDILDFARIESGKMKLDALACDPRESIEEALDLLATKAAEKNLELLHRVAPDVPAALVTDGGRLRQILVNLVGNAVKFTETGEVEVVVQLVAGERPPDGGVPAQGVGKNCQLQFSVRDTGIGIALQEQGRLFKPFSQLDDSSTRRYSGTGLGLAICRNLVRLLGGEISVASEPGRGANFTFTITGTIAAPPPPPRDLGGLPLALAGPAGSLRTQLATLARGWSAAVETAESIDGLAEMNWEVALVDVTEAVAATLVAAREPIPGIAPSKCFGLVPISLASERRQALRTHFRLLINKPVHHEALYGLLSGANPRPPARPPQPTHFGLRILVVEDNAVNQRLLQRVLETLGCAYTVVENGRRALEELGQRAADFDIVLLDFHMPEMDGITALEEIRAGQAGPRAQTIWVIALTADARVDQRARAVAAGINDYLTKPLKTPDLEAAFRRFRSERLAAKR